MCRQRYGLFSTCMQALTCSMRPLSFFSILREKKDSAAPGRQTKLAPFRFFGCEEPKKLHIRSFRLPLQNQSRRFDFERTSSVVSELSSPRGSETIRSLRGRGRRHPKVGMPGAPGCSLPLWCAKQCRSKARTGGSKVQYFTRRASVGTCGRKRGYRTALAGVMPKLCLRATVGDSDFPILPEGSRGFLPLRLSLASKPVSFHAERNGFCYEQYSSCEHLGINCIPLSTVSNSHPSGWLFLRSVRCFSGC